MVQLAKPYEPGDRVVQVRNDWIDDMLKDMGVADSKCDGQLQNAVRRYVEGEAQNAKDRDIDLTMGELEQLTHAFWTGYEQALVDAGKLEPDGRETLRT